MWGGSAVRRYTAQGKPDLVIELPVRQVTACAFGGPDLDRLYITTSRVGLEEPEPQAGALFVARPGVRGVPLPEYAG
jgi:sugar lactone lactonase YvrE